ncbi:Thiamine pyrophosphate mitochondrial carrier [Komagataella phaffii CBS 7435]|uniref:Mitochondrial membrane transporter n=2 Tax=Komagataella phaffii TaxID=460519 RepID=C4R5H0_KOMPG|nr:Mitochondrial membrane transporter [Komagataella phaffii GS115]AOA64154.1 GQ67_03853T0 [Komagataella phaffii]CAH2449410.1 Thiamine pyrophosphate mitochondrial carrier [Komagataella phaffii CBS 7435]AOA68395.1 GQ68_03826T0 [Komagataella phaffii GS115]CAY70806.1 Mitochondrial membrane transporter [Komagataella phaffii GS115]CCA39399.1 Thiamine pyrophosphate mitochondrial carrier [Komagataella phaffii CBS 7435]
MAKDDHLRQGATVGVAVSVTAGSVSGMVARAVTAPLDVIKIRLQLESYYNSHAKVPQYNGIIPTLKKIIATEGGIKRLWKGNIPAEIMYMLYGATQFTCYSTVNTFLTQTENRHNFKVPVSLHSLILGSVSGVFSTLVSYPFDVLRTRLASNRSKHFASMFGCSIDMLKHEGIKSFYSGIGTAVSGVSLSMGLTFFAYEFLRNLDSHYDELAFIEPISGFMAGIIAKSSTFPLDLIRRRLQVHRKWLGHERETFMTISKKIFIREGLRGFYSGLTPALLKTAPTTAISIWTYEYVVRGLEKAQAFG